MALQYGVEACRIWESVAPICYCAGPAHGLGKTLRIQEGRGMRVGAARVPRIAVQIVPQCSARRHRTSTLSGISNTVGMQGSVVVSTSDAGRELAIALLRLLPSAARQ